MRNASPPLVCLISVFCVSLVSFVPRVSAQQADAVGVRAQGMAGPATAVADAATASWGAPAGGGGGAYFNAMIETGRHDEPPSDRNSANARRDETRSIAVAFPALGL